MTVPPLASSSGGEHDEEDGTDDHYWVLHRVAFGFRDRSSFPNLDTDDWATVNHSLSQSPGLRSVELFCGNGASEEEFHELVESVRSQLPTIGAKVLGRYSHEISDGRDLALDLFGSDGDLEGLQRHVRKANGYYD